MKYQSTSEKAIIGLTGGIATGKSYVSSLFKKLGADVICADTIAREIVKPGSPVLTQIVKAFGQDLLLKDGSLNRATLKHIIIDSPEKRELLNKITHPEIIHLENMKVKNSSASLVIVDAPLMIESGSYKRFEKIILVYVPKNVQIERLMKRDNLSRQDADQFLKSQMPIDEKIKFAWKIIDNSGSFEQTEKHVREMYAIFQP